MKPKAHNVVFVVFLLMVFGLDAKAQAPIALVEAKLLPEGELAVRQRCELVVHFLSDGFAFSGAPSFPDVQIDGAIIIPPRSGMNIIERRNGQTWMGVERRYQVYPTRAGELVVPAVRIGASVRNSAGVTELTAKSESFVDQVVIPSALADNPDAVVTPKLSLSQTFEPDVNELKVGDAIKRAVIVTAEDTVAMLLPAVVPAEIDGFEAYPNQPVLNDREYRGSLTAMRTDSVTYIAQKEGRYEFSPISVFWWDPKQNQIREAMVPAFSLTVLVNPLWAIDPNEPMQAETGVAAPGGGAKYLIATAAIIICLFLFGVWLFRWYGHTVKDLITDFRVRRTESEQAYFARFLRACQNNDPHTALHALLAWLDRQAEFHNVTTLEEFARQVGNTELSHLIDDLYTRLYGKEKNLLETWSGEPLARAVVRSRKQGLKRFSKAQKDVGLCPLNPSA
ncbi:MAG: BatD family protein [Planctomycetota bacterium]|jgi:hypothetical protein